MTTPTHPEQRPRPRMFRLPALWVAMSEIVSKVVAKAQSFSHALSSGINSILLTIPIPFGFHTRTGRTVATFCRGVGTELLASQPARARAQPGHPDRL